MFLGRADSVPSEHLPNASWRPVAPVSVRLLLVSGAVHDAGIYQVEARTLLGEAVAKVRLVVPRYPNACLLLARHANNVHAGQGEGEGADIVVLSGGTGTSEAGGSAGQQFAMMAAALW